MAGAFPSEGMELTHILVVSDLDRAPTITFAPPPDPDTVSSSFTIRVGDCQKSYETLKSRGAQFLTPPFDWGGEIRCFFRDPDGHLFEISQAG